MRERTAQAPSPVGGQAPARRRRRGRIAEAESRRVQIVSRAATESATDAAVARGELEDLWDRHGGSAYALACALLGNEKDAAEAVRLAMSDLARSIRGESTEEARRRLVRQVFRHAQELDGETPGKGKLPPVMVWLSRLARLQRASLALCVFGGLTYREAAALLDVPPRTVADLLTSGLRELRRFSAAPAVTCA
ncbi:MAG: RNA polymerase sigma factor [Mycobacteriaceae bacterium]